MIKSTHYLFAAGFAAISAVAAFPCQAQTVVELTNIVTKTNKIIQTENQDINNNIVGDRANNINNSQPITISETSSIPANSSAVASPIEKQPVRSNPLGCRFFSTPSMQQ